LGEAIGDAADDIPRAWITVRIIITLRRLRTVRVLYRALRRCISVAGITIRELLGETIYDAADDISRTWVVAVSVDS
jgi:hypothetical protein